MTSTPRSTARSIGSDASTAWPRSYCLCGRASLASFLVPDATSLSLIDLFLLLGLYFVAFLLTNWVPAAWENLHTPLVHMMGRPPCRAWKAVVPMPALASA